VRSGLDRGDGRLGLALLKGMGMVAAEAPGSKEPETVKREIDLAKRKEEVKLKKGEGEVWEEERWVG
jgi:hypothetical protein